MKWPLTRRESLQVTAIGVPVAIVAAIMALAGAGMLAFYVVPLTVIVPTLMLLERSRPDRDRSTRPPRLRSR